MAMPMHSAWTAEMVLALPDDGLRHEVIDGEHIVTPAPEHQHQRAVARLLYLLADYLEVSGLAEVLSSPADIVLDPHTLVQPDLFVVPYVEGRRCVPWGDIPGLRVAIEVLSPSTARTDRGTKRRRFQRAGIPEYWIVDLDARVVERWQPGDHRPEILDEKLTWQIDAAQSTLVIDLPAFFTRVLGEP